MVALKLAQVAFLLDELNVMVFTIQAPFVCNVVGWADDTSSMSTFEAALVVCSSIYRDLKVNFI